MIEYCGCVVFLATNLADSIDASVIGRVNIQYTYDDLGANAKSAIPCPRWMEELL